MNTFESCLKKDDFFQKVLGMNISGVLYVDETGRKKEAVGFIINGIWVSIFIATDESVWVALKKAKGTTEDAKEILRRLCLKCVESYPLVLDKPSSEVMQIWKKKQSSQS